MTDGGPFCSKPISGLAKNPLNGWGATIVDSLSTLLLMNLTSEYSLARTHVRQIDFTLVQNEQSLYNKDGEPTNVPVFETIIRYLGGLISAYDLTGGTDELMLERAKELADWLMGAFEYVHRLKSKRLPDWINCHDTARSTACQRGNTCLATN
jgi:mannosyl-oligosaccharide alpha-1,2-mannosidase